MILTNKMLHFCYFGEKEPEDSGWEIFTAGIYYRLDNKEIERSIDPYNFTVVEDNRRLIEKLPHGFMFCETIRKERSNHHVFEIRTKNKNDDWQNWQILTGNEFDVYSVEMHCNELYIKFPIEDEIAKLSDFFQIRHGGLLYVNNYGERQVITEDGMINEIDNGTNKIKCFIDSGNQCWSFDERVKALQEFENKYYIYNSDGKRL